MADTAGLLQFIVVPPAAPETANVPVHGNPETVCALNVNVPENEVAVVVPLTVPLNVCAAYVPFTELDACVRFNAIAWTPGAPRASSRDAP